MIAVASSDSAALARRLEGYGLAADALAQSHPSLFSGLRLTLSAAEQQAMAHLIEAIESVVALPAYREAVLARAPDIARHDPGHPGAFMGYDFHLTPNGPRLIEINSNAGGGFLCALSACPDPADGKTPQPVFAEFAAMFREEARLAGWSPKAPLRLAIIDDTPSAQFLWPEFALAQRVLSDSGFTALIADPAELVWDGARLLHASGPVDLVYNRLTDFALQAPSHAALKAAWLAGRVVLTPHPRTHALYADKLNLTLLSDPEWLVQADVPETLRQRLLTGIPRTLAVAPEQAEFFWQQRKTLFFKPRDGFGSRAAYRGDKLTRRVFEEILAGDYVAQTLVPPPTCRLPGADAPELKLDVRQYVYRGRIQLSAARLYQGQTTNMRTPGGGFAAVETAFVTCA